MRRGLKRFLIHFFLPTFILLGGIYTYIKISSNNPNDAGHTLPTTAPLNNSAPSSEHQNDKITPPKRIIENGWELIWIDEFDEKGVNPQHWNFEDWASEKNKELQYYSPNNITIENNQLHIIAKNELYRGRRYTSGAMHTKDKFSFLYGKVEMRAKLPKGKGIFPAFWMLPNKDNTWLPEIDILEMIGQKPAEIWMVLHWLDEHQKLQNVSHTYIGEDFTKDFHTFGIEWTPQSITWLIDGKEQFKATKHIPNEPMYLYVNTAIGGVWPGSPDNTTVFPNTFAIDYIKVFKKTGGFEHDNINTH